MGNYHARVLPGSDEQQGASPDALLTIQTRLHRTHVRNHEEGSCPCEIQQTIETFHGGLSTSIKSTEELHCFTWYLEKNAALATCRLLSKWIVEIAGLNDANEMCLPENLYH